MRQRIEQASRRVRSSRLLGTFTFYSVLILTCVSFVVRARADDPRPISVLVDDTLRPLVDTGKVVGMTVGVIDGDEWFVFGLGRVAVDKAEVPNGSTVFEIGSISKVFTAVILAEMVERQELAPDDPVGALLPSDVVMPSRDGKVITLRHLATHASGLPRIPSNLKFNPSDPYKNYTEADLFQFLAKHELKRAPGEKVEYSNLGMGLLGVALCKKAGVSTYEELFISQIAAPLGMNDTSVVLNDHQRARLATGHTRQGARATNWELITLAGAGGIRSNVDDMLRFTKTCLHSDESILGKALRRTFEPQRDMVGGKDRIGLAWVIRGDGTLFHNGQTGGYHAFLGLRPDKRLGLVVLSNTSSEAVDEPCFKLLTRLAERSELARSR